MALEPLLPAATQDDRELRAVRRKFWISSGLSAPVVLIAMVSHVLPVSLGMGGTWPVRYIEVLLTAPVVLWAGADYYRRGWLGVINRSPNMYTLIGLGVAVAYLYSLVATFVPAAFPAEMRDAHGMVGVYFEAAASIVTLVLLGEWLELAAPHRGMRLRSCHWQRGSSARASIPWLEPLSLARWRGISRRGTSRIFSH
jgi:Cu+-exporting ATPase